ncbi:hypothetical protein D3C75_1233050 [compost metagenome]
MGGFESSGQMLLEERCQLVKRDHVYTVIEIGVVGAWDDYKLLRLSGRSVGCLTEIARVGLFAVDKQYRPW